ncbi:hypothetical protein D3C80_1554340 [compost metagenome]
MHRRDRKANSRQHDKKGSAGIDAKHAWSGKRVARQRLHQRAGNRETRPNSRRYEGAGHPGRPENDLLGDSLVVMKSRIPSGMPVIIHCSEQNARHRAQQQDDGAR